MTRTISQKPHVVIVGGGFGGLKAAKAFKKAPVQITLIDRTNHHLFQPLLYQVATAGLSPADIAMPLRSILAEQKNVSVLLDEVKSVDLPSRTIQLLEKKLHYDYLILATGAQTSYFGHQEWARYAVGLKDLDDAVEIRRRILLAFEEAEREEDEALRRKLLTFIVIGGGPTGVEMAGAVAELAKYALASDFRAINPSDTNVILMERADRVLATFPEDLSKKAAEQLQYLGVKLRLGVAVTNIDAHGVHLGDEYVPAETVIWGAGVQTTPLTKSLGVELDRGGRVLVEPDLSIPKYPEVFVVGDACAYLHQDGKPLPGVAQVAMQQGMMAVSNVLRAIEGQPREKFVYNDKGNMATIGRSAAIVEMGKTHISGFFAWCMWLAVHIIFLIGFRNKISVFITWVWSYITYKRGARLITGHRMDAGTPEMINNEAPLKPVEKAAEPMVKVARS